MTWSVRTKFSKIFFALEGKKQTISQFEEKAQREAQERWKNLQHLTSSPAFAGNR